METLPSKIYYTPHSLLRLLLDCPDRRRRHPGPLVDRRGHPVVGELPVDGQPVLRLAAEAGAVRRREVVPKIHPIIHYYSACKMLSRRIPAPTDRRDRSSEALHPRVGVDVVDAVERHFLPSSGR